LHATPPPSICAVLLTEPPSLYPVATFVSRLKRMTAG
jgi:hypothetical protein